MYDIVVVQIPYACNQLGTYFLDVVNKVGPPLIFQVFLEVAALHQVHQDVELVLLC